MSYFKNKSNEEKCGEEKCGEEKGGEHPPPQPKKAWHAPSPRPAVKHRSTAPRPVTTTGPPAASYFVQTEKDPSVAYKPHPSQLFVSTAQISDGIDTIPNMTDGLRLALQSLQIECVSQLLAELIKRVHGVSSDGEKYLETKEEILEDYLSWLTSIARGSEVEKTRLKAIADTMVAFAEEHGLALTASDQ